MVPRPGGTGAEDSGRMAEDRLPAEGGTPPSALFVGLARAKSLGVASEGWRQVVRDECKSREATREPGGWRSPEVVDRVYSKTWPEEVAPKMRAAATRASGRVEMGF